MKKLELGLMSAAGKDAAEKYNIFKKRAKYLNNLHSIKRSLKKFSLEEEKIGPIKDEEEKINEIDIFKHTLGRKFLAKKKNHMRFINLRLYSNKIKDKNCTAYKKLDVKKLFSNEENDKINEGDLNKHKYHDQHMQRVERNIKSGFYKKINERKEAAYNPNMSYIWRKTNTGPKWKKLTGRKNNSLEVDNRDYLSFNKTDGFNTKNSSVFLDMKKQTQRDGLDLDKDLRKRHEKKFEELDRTQEKLRWEKVVKTFSMPSKLSATCFSFAPLKYTFQKKEALKRKKALLSRIKNTTKKKWEKYPVSNLSKKLFKMAPDFRNSLSREKIDKLHQKLVFDHPDILFPNYSYVQPKVKNLVNYSTSNTNCNKQRQNDYEQMRINSSSLYNATKCFELYKPSKCRVVPSFKKMCSRPIDNKDPLPSFMKNLYGKIGSYLTTDKTLKMNNFANGKYLSSDNITMNKKSYNKYINLSLLKSDMISSDNLKDRSEFKNLVSNVGYVHNFKGKSYFYKYNYDQLKDSINLNKFDKITLKSLCDGGFGSKFEGGSSVVVCEEMNKCKS